MSDTITLQDKKQALKFAYQIIADKRNANRYGGTALARKDSPEMFTYTDMLRVLNGMYKELEAAPEKKLQKPMTLEDIKPGKVLFIEFHDDCYPDIEPVKIIEGLSYNLVGYEKLGWSARFNIDGFSYGRSWRCWASRPTDEELKAAPWEV